MRKIIVDFLVVIFAASIVFVSGAPAIEAEAAATTSLKGEVLTIATAWADKEFQMFKPVLDAFEKETGVKIKHQMFRAEELTSALVPMFQVGKSTIDVAFFPWPGIFRELGEEGYMLDLTDFAKEWNYIPGTLEAGMSSKTGELYMMPQSMYINAVGMIRKPFAEEHGLEVPETWDEFLDLLEKIKGIDGVQAPIFVPGASEGWGCRILFEDIVIAFGGKDLFFDLVKDKVPFNSEEVKNVLRHISTLQKNGYFSEPKDFVFGCKQWAKGELPVAIGPSIIPSIGGVDPDDTIIFLMPGPVRDGIIGGVPGIAIQKYKKNIEAAKSLIRFCLNTDQLKLYLNNSRNFKKKWSIF